MAAALASDDVLVAAAAGKPHGRGAAAIAAVADAADDDDGFGMALERCDVRLRSSSEFEPFARRRRAAPPPESQVWPEPPKPAASALSPVHILRGGVLPAAAVAISSDLDTVATLFPDGAITLHTARRGRFVRRLGNPKGDTAAARACAAADASALPDTTAYARLSGNPVRWSGFARVFQRMPPAFQRGSEMVSSLPSWAGAGTPSSSRRRATSSPSRPTRPGPRSGRSRATIRHRSPPRGSPGASRRSDRPAAAATSSTAARRRRCASAGRTTSTSATTCLSRAPRPARVSASTATASTSSWAAATVPSRSWRAWRRPNSFVRISCDDSEFCPNRRDRTWSLVHILLRSHPSPAPGPSPRVASTPRRWPPAGPRARPALAPRA